MSHTVIVSSILEYSSLFLMILLFLMRFFFSFERVSCSYILLFPLSFIAAGFFSSTWSSIISFLFLVTLLVEHSPFSVWLYKLVLFFCISSSSCFARFSLTSFSFFLFCKASSFFRFSFSSFSSTIRFSWSISSFFFFHFSLVFLLS